MDKVRLSLILLCLILSLHSRGSSMSGRAFGATTGGPLAKPSALSCLADKEDVSRNRQKERVMRQYQQLYLESVCQREAGNYVAQYRLLERALKINPEGAEAYFDMAMVQRAGDKTLDYLGKAYALRPDNKDYMYEYAQCLLAHDDTTGLALMESLLSDAERRDDVYTQLCNYYIWKDDYDGICRTLEKWRRIRDDDEFLSSRKLFAAMELGRLDEGLLITDTLIERYPANAVRYKVVKGEILLGLSREEEALDLYRSLTAEETTEAGAQILLYKYAVKTGDKSLETRVLKDIVVNSDVSMRTREAALVQYLGPTTANDYAARRDTLLELLLPLPEEDPALFVTMLSQMQSEEDDSLRVPLFNKLLEINPADEYSRINLMQHSLRHDDYDEVQRLCTDGLKENASQPLFYYFGGAGLMVAKKYAEALELFERGRAHIDGTTNTELVSSYYGSYGDALHQMGRNNEAYAMYDSALVYNNGNEMCLNNYAYFLALDNEQLDKAERMSAYTVEMHPEQSTYLDTYAWILFLKGDYEKAREYIDKALAHIDDREDQDNASLYEHAGDIYWHLGLSGEAVGYWRQAQSLDRDSAILKKKVNNRKYYKE